MRKISLTLFTLCFVGATSFALGLEFKELEKHGVYFNYKKNHYTDCNQQKLDVNSETVNRLPDNLREDLKSAINVLNTIERVESEFMGKNLDSFEDFFAKRNSDLEQGLKDAQIAEAIIDTNIQVSDSVIESYKEGFMQNLKSSSVRLDSHFGTNNLYYCEEFNEQEHFEARKQKAREQKQIRRFSIEYEIDPNSYYFDDNKKYDDCFMEKDKKILSYFPSKTFVLMPAGPDGNCAFYAAGFKDKNESINYIVNNKNTDAVKRFLNHLVSSIDKTDLDESGLYVTEIAKEVINFLQEKELRREMLNGLEDEKLREVLKKIIGNPSYRAQTTTIINLKSATRFGSGYFDRLFALKSKKKVNNSKIPPYKTDYGCLRSFQKAKNNHYFLALTDHTGHTTSIVELDDWWMMIYRRLHENYYYMAENGLTEITQRLYNNYFASYHKDKIAKNFNNKYSINETYSRAVKYSHR